ncbi:class I SAM-dependent methyltransferase [Actinocrispum sp. NPDC049592]|uniref:class I SAM-dependent DNA methyltransferase n=1 Tax=Actinocrispum sp. NPDC049592 TaxID=3154835 RepID=UPI00341F11B0
MTRPYDALALVYDRWNAEADYQRWAGFLHSRFAGERISRVLDVCCGTGRMIGPLQELGYEVSGVDGSAAMLTRAAANVSPGTRLRHAMLPGAAPEQPVADAAISCFDSVNYFVSDEDLRGLFRFVANSLRPGGLYAFDLNSPYKLRTFYGDHHHGDDFGEFAYVWRNRIDGARIRFLITIFTREGELFRRHEEVHEQRLWEIAELTAAARDSGFEVVEILDNYQPVLADDETLRQTWILRRASA